MLFLAVVIYLHQGRILRGGVETWAYGKEKIRGAEINLPDFFGLCPTSPEKFFLEEINFGDFPMVMNPPRRQKNFDLQNFSEHQTTFPYITKLTTKLT
jgi:hypothetical protein